MIVIVLEYLESNIVSLGNVHLAIESEETIISVHPSRVTRVSEVS